MVPTMLTNYIYPSNKCTGTSNNLDMEAYDRYFNCIIINSIITTVNYKYGNQYPISLLYNLTTCSQ